MQKSFFTKPEFVVSLLMVLAAAFSIFFMLPQSVGLDESQSLWQASHSLGGILYVVAQDVHVPLYHFMLHFWMIAFGTGASADRVLSLVFYLVSIPLVYLLGKIAFDEKTALFGVVIFTLSPFTNWYGSIIRMYSLLTLVTVINQIFFILIYKGDPKRRRRYWIGYFISAFFGIYTHYFFFFVLAVEGIFVLSYRKIFPPNAIRNFCIIAVILAILFAPWLLYVHSVGGLGANTSPKLLPPTTVDVANTFSNFFFGFQTNAINTIILSLWPLATLLLIFALQRNNRITPEAVYFITTTFAPILGGALLSNLIIPFYLSRYYIGIFPSCCLAASWLFYLYPRAASAIARTALASAMVVMLGFQTATASTVSPIKEDYRDAADYVAANATARDIVAVSTPFTIYPIEYYYNGPAVITTLPIWDRLASGPIPSYSTSTIEANLATFDTNHQYLWLILSYNQGYETSLKTYLDTHFALVETKTFSPDLDLYVYRLDYTNTTLSDMMSLVNGTTSTSTTTSSTQKL